MPYPAREEGAVNRISVFTCNFMSNPVLLKNSSDSISPITGGIRVLIFLKSRSLKENIKGQLEFELAYFEATVQHVSNYNFGPPKKKS